jgi:hypothetical protein
MRTSVCVFCFQGCVAKIRSFSFKEVSRSTLELGTMRRQTMKFCATRFWWRPMFIGSCRMVILIELTDRALSVVYWCPLLATERGSGSEKTKRKGRVSLCLPPCLVLLLHSLLNYWANLDMEDPGLPLRDRKRYCQCPWSVMDSICKNQAIKKCVRTDIWIIF